MNSIFTNIKYADDTMLRIGGLLLQGVCGVGFGLNLFLSASRGICVHFEIQSGFSLLSTSKHYFLFLWSSENNVSFCSLLKAKIIQFVMNFRLIYRQLKSNPWYVG